MKYVFVIRERLLLEYERTGELLVDLGSDQTSLHNPFNGGYYPVQLSFRQANQLMSTDPSCFRAMVQQRFNKPIFFTVCVFRAEITECAAAACRDT